MSFNSPEFLLFFLAVFLLHWLFPPRLRNLFLLLSSYAFYASGNWRQGLILLFLTAVSYLAGSLIRASAKPRARIYAALAVCTHLATLGFFKFDLIFGGTARALLWPLGISYYTFASMGYVLDVYRGHACARNMVDHALFLSFFPQIIAGPIARTRDLLLQIQRHRPFDRRRLQEGCHLIAWGLFQKVFVANNLAPKADALLAGPHPREGPLALLGLYGFALQLFSDFSGYSDMARGLGKCLGFELARNFDGPFFALDMQDFWKRWHISLSNWFMDFLYKPLLKVRSLPFRLYGAPILTMTAMGLWHGAKTTTVFMGFYYGLILTLTGLIKSKLTLSPPGRGGAFKAWTQRILTFHLACAGLMLLRTKSVKQALFLLSRVFCSFSFSGEAAQAARWLIFFGWPLVLVEALNYRKGDLALLGIHPALRAYFYILMFCLVMLFGNFGNTAYFYSAF